jgi:hypothetical protein
VNLLPYLTGKNTGTPHEAIYLRMFDKGAYTVRSGDTKLIIERTGKAPELYDLKADIGEERNLALSRDEDLAALEKMRVAWDKQLIPPVFEGLKMKPKAKGKDDSAEDP